MSRPADYAWLLAALAAAEARAEAAEAEVKRLRANYTLEDMCALGEVRFTAGFRAGTEAAAAVLLRYSMGDLLVRDGYVSMRDHLAAEIRALTLAAEIRALTPPAAGTVSITLIAPRFLDPATGAECPPCTECGSIVAAIVMCTNCGAKPGPATEMKEKA